MVVLRLGHRMEDVEGNLDDEYNELLLSLLVFVLHIPNLASIMILRCLDYLLDYSYDMRH